ncbi:hypothetical protein L5515_004079 [Caenorhabditis briggsae]|nr:hypothetical protein L3Y34_001221 [Caenorhabditis briggsae]UMM23280.1 hypothetical protein L5515_004079 [Caenorhabditis briggsae]
MELPMPTVKQMNLIERLTEIYGNFDFCWMRSRNIEAPNTLSLPSTFHLFEKRLSERVKRDSIFTAISYISLSASRIVKMINVTPEGIILMFLLAFHIWCVVYS